MTFSQRAVLAGLAALLVLLPGCEHASLVPPTKGPKCGFSHAGPGPGNHYGQGSPREFRVYLYTDANGTCYADTDVASLWTTVKGSSVQQTVCWVSDDRNDYNVNFKRGKRQQSPFAGDNFPIAGSGNGPGTYESGSIVTGSKGYYDFVIVRGTDPSGPICSSAYQDPGYRVSP